MRFCKFSMYKYLFLLFFLLNQSQNVLYSQSLAYYIDSFNGNDNSDGKTKQTAWKSLNKISNTTFFPGDKILFLGNGIWEGQLWPKGSGNVDNPITIGMYGAGNNPLIIGKGSVQNVVYLFNQEYWTINDLEITNYKEGDNNIKRGVYILGKDYGTIHNIRLVNLKIHDINSLIDEKNGGGIFIEITGNAKPTNFDSLIIEGCRVYDVDRTGISNSSEWAERTLTTNSNWFPSTNLIVRNNWIERTGGNGMIIRVASKPTIENNIFKQCGLKTSGNAVFTFNCDDALVQYNESYQTVYNSGDADASGFDSDYRCKRSVFQYNYSHDNDDGFILVCCQGGSTRFNDSTIIRYNISQNDGAIDGGIIRISGQTTNTYIYNNVIYYGGSNNLKRVIYHKSWDAYPDKTNYYNNIFYILKTPSSTYYSQSSSTKNVFDYNLFFGQHSPSEPNDPHKIISDPKFLNPGSGYEGINSVDGYQLLPDSPCIGAGLFIKNNGSRDYSGKYLPSNGRIDIGAYQLNALTTISKISFPTGNNRFILNQNYPNPFNPDTKISYHIPENGFVSISVYNMLGKVVKSICNETQTAGNYEIMWNGNSNDGFVLSSGIYYCRIQFGEYSKTIKMLMMK